MKQSFIGLCSEFANKALYNFTLFKDIPNKDIMKTLEPKGYKVVPYVPSENEILMAAASAGRVAYFLPTRTIVNARGVDVIRDDGAARETYRRDLRHVAAEYYGIKP